MDKTFYKTEDPDNGYSKYIKDEVNFTTILHFGSVPVQHIIRGPYPKLPGEVLQECNETEYSAMDREFMLSLKKTYRIEPITAL